MFTFAFAKVFAKSIMLKNRDRRSKKLTQYAVGLPLETLRKSNGKLVEVCSLHFVTFGTGCPSTIVPLYLTIG